MSMLKGCMIMPKQEKAPEAREANNMIMLTGCMIMPLIFNILFQVEFVFYYYVLGFYIPI